MKNAPLYTRRIRKLITQLRKEGVKPTAASVAPTGDLEATRILLLGVFCRHASEQRSASALDKLMGAMVDLNELRVTPVAEIVEIVGVGFPHCRSAAEEILQVLTSIFNRIHDLDLSFLKGLGKRSAAAFINSLDGLGAHASAFFKQRHLGIHIIPLDARMFSFLHKGEFVAEKVDVEEAQRFCATLVKERDGLSLYNMFKRYAATHSPPKSKKKTGADKKTLKKRPPKKKAVKKKEAAGKTGGKKTPARSAKKLAKKSAAKKTTAKRSARKTSAKKAATPRTSTKKAASKKSALRKAAAKKRPASKKSPRPAKAVARTPAKRGKKKAARSAAR